MEPVLSVGAALCFRGCTKGVPLSHWIVEVTALAYTSQAETFPLEVGPITLEAWRPRGLGQEVFLFRIFAWPQVGLLRLHLVGFII